MQFDRRAFLRLAALAPFAASAFAEESHLLQMNGYPLNAETPLESLTDYLTPNELFFVRSHWIPRMPDMKTWRLVVDGDVRTERRRFDGDRATVRAATVHHALKTLVELLSR